MLYISLSVLVLCLRY